MSVPQINTGKHPQQFLNVSQILPLPSDTPFGNFALKYLKIVSRIDQVNSLIQDVFSSFSLAHQSQGFDENFFRHQLIAEEVIYWLRKTADELISLQYVLYIQEQIGQFPTKVEVDCIGLLNHQNTQQTFKENFAAHLSFLKILNEVSNAYKHSFINSEISSVGTEEPYVFALALKKNDLGNQPKFHSVPFAELVVGFDSFFQDSVEELRKCNLPHLSNPTF
ncbi:hypothetical protein [Nostoc sp.]|uniref:hypothetical protein n=1 Tax=Nostoc sp. TaxID=1180 RepID=UPI002FFA46F3